MRTRTRKVIRVFGRSCVALVLVGTVTLLQGCDSSGAGSTSTAKAGASGSGGGGNSGGGSTAASGATSMPSGGSSEPATTSPPTGGSSEPATTSPPTGGSTEPATTSPPTGGSTVTGGRGPAAGTPAAGTPAAGTPATGGRGAAGTPATGGRGAAGTPATGGSPAAGTPATGGSPATGGTPTTFSGTGHYQMENLDRGLVAVVVTGGVYVGWRMFGYEYTGTNTDTSYNLYKGGTKLANVTDSTNYLDAAGTASSSYTVSCVLKGVEGPQSPAVTPWAQQYTSIPLTPPATSSSGATYSASDGATGDLNGDGQLDIVLKWDPSDSHDNAQSGNTSDVFVDGYTLAGKFLWRIDLGPNIRAGAHYTQLSVYDFDGDGKAEFACKTAPGTKDGTGAYLSTGTAAGADNSAIYRNTSGYILTGPEWFTVFAGDTGKELATIDYPVPRGTVSAWGDAYGNRVDRFNGGFAFTKDGQGAAAVANGLPSMISGRGYYTRLTVSSMTYRNGVLAKNWVFDSVTSMNQYGAGCHSEMAADVDNDGAQEVITGQTTIEDDGTLKCVTGLGHGDAMDVSELVPGKGITVFQIHEGLGGMDAHDGATCTRYFQTTEPGTDSNRGRADYVGAGDETSASCECGSCTEHLALCADGTTTVTVSPGTNFVIYWDADLWREIENGTSITKASGTTLLNATGCGSNNGTKSTPTLTADLLGDWREEIVYRESTNTALRVYTTTDVTTNRIYTLMHDPTYRAQANFENSAYNQPPHTGFQISPNMAAPPVPDIFVVK
ncbi:MAG: rhamnogalacturonan lyase [Polyangia bacterium]